MDRQTILDLIQKYHKKIEIYQTMIAELQSELGEAASPVPSMSSDVKKPRDASTPVSAVMASQFFNKSQPDAKDGTPTAPERSTLNAAVTGQ